jgi:flagellar hook-associated protein 3 FlgL
VTERITSQMTAQMTVSELNQAYDRLAGTQTELSSGLRTNQPSDDPYGASLALQLKGQISALGAYAQNINDATGWTQLADSSLMNINDQAQSVRELLVGAANGTSTQSELNSDAAQVDQLIAGIKQDANAEYDGQYIFTGTANVAAYQSGTTDTYQGNSAAINRQIGPGTTVQVNTDISQLLGSGQPAADGKLLDVLRTVSQDMKTGNTGALGTDLQNLDTNLNTLGQLQANVGSVEDQLQLASSRIQDLQVQDQQQLSNTQDADMAQTMTNFTTEQASYTAALQASAKILQTDSLLNFLS